jgi:hypothetical protein
MIEILAQIWIDIDSKQGIYGACGRKKNHPLKKK